MLTTQCYCQIQLEIQTGVFQTQHCSKSEKPRDSATLVRNYKPCYRHSEAAWADGEILMGKAIDDACRDPSKLDSFFFYGVSNGRNEVPRQLPSQPPNHVDFSAQSRYPIYSSSTPIFVYQSTDKSAVLIRANLPTLTNRTPPRSHAQANPVLWYDEPEQRWHVFFTLRAAELCYPFRFPGSWTHSNCYCIR
ncbi:hypothetical protein GE21DRAFT_1134242 [Neurospora crassa]|nr:hypothetical protein GE21DRAFT_1134242 [Neurospora crassa]